MVLMTSTSLGSPLFIGNSATIFQKLNDSLDQLGLLLLSLDLQRLSTSLGDLVNTFQMLLGKFNVFQSQFIVDNFQVIEWVDFVIDMNDVCIVETSHHLENSIDSSNIGQEIVTQSFTRVSTFSQSSNIIYGHVGTDLTFGLVHVTQLLET
ncbi:hypothetical protein PGUG_04256 [Meyerozyma guilliermondii ATCC 6260]|uniref:Uncharacterized protein n=1 Tax=Meyerozyma guilliermondii (strain ATCC 6260 / CBS 566 / DSM 6381 / JCM 1539 / NBRC 10279 / NRRL Y-324) TaxID=294746 RepID=A5DLV5_PICGU|nr:uncharacterized protein PGUG_04256 [Meyerozyma guilliermondii ATCC 6260]EDK40156.2 hypothetical protein PGUG_04256 [Meyerozyma guilliermondii ATCC 6260]